jgi:hypothetical protein
MAHNHYLVAGLDFLLSEATFRRHDYIRCSET